MMINLKPCPFCGGEAHLVHGAKRYVYPASPGAPKTAVTGAVIYCDNCTAQMFLTNEVLLVEAWNRREKLNQQAKNWESLRRTIEEMRDNGGTGTQQGVCRFLANLMDVLEKKEATPWKPMT